MYVCLCNGVTHRQIEAAVESGCRSVNDLTRELGVAAGCGQCAATAAEILAGVDPLAEAHADGLPGPGVGATRANASHSSSEPLQGESTRG